MIIDQVCVTELHWLGTTQVES